MMEEGLVVLEKVLAASLPTTIIDVSSPGDREVGKTDLRHCPLQ